MEYDLELDKVVKKIKDSKAKMVLLQFPDGLKTKAIEVVDFIDKETEADVHIWSGSNYGGCDLPVLPEDLKYDLLIHFGHNEF